MKEQLQYCEILKTKINVTDMEKTVGYITTHLEALKGNYICVSNVHTTVTAYRDEAYRNVQNSGAMALPDGQPLSIVSRSRGCKDAKRELIRLTNEIIAFSKDKTYGSAWFYIGMCERMLLSCLIDADWRDTSDFMAG